jgi:hypothetical protein
MSWDQMVDFERVDGTVCTEPRLEVLHRLTEQVTVALKSLARDRFVMISLFIPSLLSV